MERPELTVVPEHVTSRLIVTLEKLCIAESRIEPELRNYRLLLNSGARDETTYEFPTDYQLQLPETIYGMEKITLQKAVFPMSLDLINTNSADFTITCEWTGPTAGTSNYTSTIPTGNYTITTLATAFQTSLNDIASSTAPFSTTAAVFTVTIDPTSLIMTITNTVAPQDAGGLATAVTMSAASSSAYFRAITGLPAVAGSPGASPGAVLIGTESVNVAYPHNLFIYLDNKSYDFNSLRIMKSLDIDERCFANFNMPSGTTLLTGIASAGDVNGQAILTVDPTSPSAESGVGTYVVTKDTTNAYYKAYEGPIPSVRYLNIRIKQRLPDGTMVVPDFKGANHSMELEMKARVDKMSAIVKPAVFFPCINI